MEFSLDTRLVGAVTVVRAAGELDLDSGPVLRDHLVKVLNTEGQGLVVDLTEVGFLDSSGLQALISTLRRCQLVGRWLRLVVVRRGVLDVFEVTGTAAVFSIHPSVEDALPDATGRSRG